MAWLDGNGFALSERALPIVQEYIDAGQYFLAARIDLDAMPATAAYLTPLQFRYQSDAFSLPIRIGTTVAEGAQELVIYALTADSDGRVAVANYPETAIADECMLPEGTNDNAAWYATQLDAAYATGIWLTEYAWSPSGCDPCSSDPPSAEVLTALGAPVSGYGGFITRLRVRYLPEEATQDLVLYATHGTESDQIRYITYEFELESTFETCGIGTPDEPGSCEGQETQSTDPGAEPEPDPAMVSADCGCAAGGSGAGGASLLAGVVFCFGRRRR